MTRLCGECVACCRAVAVTALQKRAGTTCTHCSNGCTVYDTRPAECAEYVCLWLEGFGEDENRPDKLGAIIDVHRTGCGSVIMFHKLRDVIVNAPEMSNLPYAVVETDGVSTTLFTPASWSKFRRGRFIKAFKKIDTRIP